MSEEGIKKIKTKLQELTNLIKEETSEETQELKDEILEGVKELKSTVEEKLADADKLGNTIENNLEELLGDLEGKALKVKYTILERYSQGIAQKDELINDTADSLIEAINKVKNAVKSK